MSNVKQVWDELEPLIVRARTSHWLNEDGNVFHITLPAERLAALLARTVALEAALRMVVEKLKAHGMQRSSLSGMLWCYPHFTQAECEQAQAALAPRPRTEEDSHATS